MERNQVNCPVGTTPNIVKAGDTFFTIARSFNISLDSLIAANPGVDPNRLFIGQTICVPTGTQPGLCPTLRVGSRGASVQRLQTLLIQNGFNPGPVDGIFGPQTQAAVIAFQRSRFLVPDGIVGIQTWTALGVNCGGPTPPPTTCPVGTFPHTVQAGDTFYNLAIKYNTTVAAIQRANPNVNPNNLQIGQIICIPRV